MKNKISVIIQARMNSSRLPGKVLKKILNKPLIEFLIERVSMSKLIDEIIIATSNNSEDDCIAEYCNKYKIKYFRGSELNVLSRFYEVSMKNNLTNIVRICADSPLIDNFTLDKMIKIFFENKKYDYLSNTINQTYPVGMNIEIFTLTALKKAYLNHTKDYESEHVTPYIFMNPELFNIGQEHLSENYSNIRVTVDFEEDFIVIKKILEIMYTKNKYFGLNDIIKLYKSNPEIFLINRHLTQKSF